MGTGQIVSARSLQALAARDEERDRRARQDELRDQVCDVGEQVLGVVEHEQGALPEQCFGQRGRERLARLFPHVHGLRDCRQDEVGVAEWGEVDPCGSVRVVKRRAFGGTEREAGLAGAPRARQREQSRVRVGQERGHGLDLGRAPEERRPGDGERAAVERPQRWMLAGPQLVDPLRLPDVLEPMLAEVGELVVVANGYRRDGFGGQDDLSAVGRVHDPRRAMDVEPDVLRRVQRGSTGVDPHADRDQAAVELGDGLAHRIERRRWLREGEEERVSLVVDLVAAVALACTPDHDAVVDERRPVPLHAEALEQPRRPLDIREHQRHRPRRLRHRRHARIVVREHLRAQ